MRILRNTVLAIVVLVVLVLIGLATPPGRGLVANVIARAASGNGLTVTIAGPTGWPPFSFGAERVVLADGDGTFAEIDGLSAGLQLTRLLTGTVAFDAIDATRVEIARRPHLTGGSGGGGGGLVPFAIDSFKVGRLELGAQLAGRKAALTVSASASAARNGALAANVTVARIDGANGTFTATLARPNAASPLTADVSLIEGADGILVGLMGRSTGPGFALTIATGVSGTTISGSASLKSEGKARFDGTFSLTPAADGGSRVELAGNGDLAELVPPGYADLLSGPIDIAVDADVAREAGKALPRIAIRKGTITTGSVSAQASGTLGEATSNLALKMDVAKPGGGRIAVPGFAAGGGFDTVSLNGTVAPKANALRLDLTGKVAGLKVGNVTVPGIGASLAVEARGDDPLASKTLPFAVRVEASAIGTDAGTIQSHDAAPILLTGDGTFDVAGAAAKLSAKLALAGGTTDFAGTASADGVAGKANVAYADLAPLSPLAGRALAGSFSGTADGTFTGKAPKVSVTGTATDLDPGNAAAAKLLAGKTDIAATVTWAADGSLALSGLRVTGGALKATGALALGPDTIDGSLDGTVSDLALVANGSSGAVAFGAKISGERARPKVEMNVTVARGRLLGQAIANAKAAFSGAPSDTGWQGALTLAGGFGGKPLSGTATVQLDPATGMLALPEINVAVGGNRIRGALTRSGAGPFDGTLAVDAPDLATLAALALVEASGTATGRVSFTADGGKQTVSADFSGKDIVASSVKIGAVDGTVRVDDALGAPIVKANATATAMSVGNVKLDMASVTAAPVSGGIDFTAKAKGPDLDLAGTGSFGGETLRIATLSGSAYGSPVRLGSPLTLALGGGATNIANADLAIGGGHVTVNGSVQPKLDLTVSVANVSAAVVNGFAPKLGAAGSVSGDVKVTGTTAAPAYTWRADWSNVGLAATRAAGLPGLTVSARGTGTATSTSLDATLGGAGMSLTVSGTVPFKGSGLALDVNGDVPVALLALATTRELQLAGTAKVALKVAGATAAPSVNGTIDLAKATLADLGSGVGITAASGQIAFDGRRATTSGITGRLSQGGDVTIAGSVSVDQPGLPADLTVRVVNGRYADGKLISAQLGANLKLTGPILGDGLLSGTVDLARTEIDLPDKIGGAPTAIAVTHVNAPPGFKPPEPAEPATATSNTGSGGTLRLSIVLNAPNGVFVRGFGIDSESGGTLTLGGTSGNPQAVGAFTMRRGRIELLGKRFNFTRGSLTFSGDLVPVLDFEATTQTSDTTVTVHVTGRANNPTISFTSSPSLPQEEIISRLLFDRSVGTLSPLQAAQLVDAVAQMTGALGGTSVFTRVRQATGLDNLDIRQNAAGGTTVGVGKRLNDRVEVGVEAASGTGGGRVTVNVDITKNLKASAEAGNNGEGKVGLSFEKEY